MYVYSGAWGGSAGWKKNHKDFFLKKAIRSVCYFFLFFFQGFQKQHIYTQHTVKEEEEEGKKNENK